MEKKGETLFSTVAKLAPPTQLLFPEQYSNTGMRRRGDEGRCRKGEGGGEGRQAGGLAQRGRRKSSSTITNWIANSYSTGLVVLKLATTVLFLYGKPPAWGGCAEEIQYKVLLLSVRGGCCPYKSCRP
eukprot:802004-Rhodomonas_salina.2